MEQYLTFMDRDESKQDYCWLDEFLELKSDPFWLSVPRLSGPDDLSCCVKDRGIYSAGSDLSTFPQVRGNFVLSSSRSLSRGSIHMSSRESVNYEVTFPKALEFSRQFFEEGATCNKLLEQLGSELFFNDPNNVFVNTLDIFSPVKRRKPPLIEKASKPCTFKNGNMSKIMRLTGILAHSSPLRQPKKRYHSTKTLKEGDTHTETLSEIQNSPKLDTINRTDCTWSSSANFDSNSDPDYSDDPRPKKMRKLTRSNANMPIKSKFRDKGSPVLGLVPFASAALVNKARLNPKSLNHAKNLICLLDQSECTIKRERYERKSMEKYHPFAENVVYEPNRNFSIMAPYQQEFTRVEIDPETKAPFPSTRSALCAYCEELSFFELKNSSYSQHMCHTHGIYTNNYLTPDPLFLGKYSVKKPSILPRKTNRRARQREGVVCPVCYIVVEVRCWKTKIEQNPFSNYLRHFKKEHRMVGSLTYFLETKN